MPFGFQRLNERQQRPNQNIVFIKPLEGPDKEVAQDFLERIAAICAPICKSNHLFVASLEEFPPNREFWGRNFNAGESIQLVLKSQNGRWLPFRFVQMVMMHELAHCQQMNHSRAFWKVRNKFAEELRELWSKGYTGDGLFGRGQSLYSGQYTEGAVPDAGDSPEHLCGGVYRSGGGRRKRKAGGNASQLTYAEKKQKRIEKKFGKAGVSLGGDEEGRIKLENGKKPKGNPRVAGSVRGRELRAAAALARFEAPSKVVEADDDETASEDDYDEPKIKIEALDGDGNKIVNEKGKAFIKVCGDEDPDDDMGARQEMEELGGYSNMTQKIKQEERPFPGFNRYNDAYNDARTKARKGSPIQSTSATNERPASTKSAGKAIRTYDDEATDSNPEEDTLAVKLEPGLLDDEETASEADQDSSTRERFSARTTGKPRKITNHSAPSDLKPTMPDFVMSPDDTAPSNADSALASTAESNTASAAPSSNTCPVCSLENDIDALRCAVCSHVLVPSSLPGCWACKTPSCKELGYVNVGDNGICGLCGASKG